MIAGWPVGRRPARRGHLRWTRHGRGGRGIGLDNPGMPATASGGSPGSWDSAAGSICRLKWMRCQEGRPPVPEPTGRFGPDSPRPSRDGPSLHGPSPADTASESARPDDAGGRN